MTQPRRDEKAEILAAYSHTNDVAATDWRVLLKQAASQIDLLDQTLTDVLTSAGTIDLLKENASAGCEIRLLLAAPDSIHLTIADAENGQDLSVIDIPESAIQADASIQLAHSLSMVPEIEARTYIAGRFNTILRFDDEMLEQMLRPQQSSARQRRQGRGDHSLLDCEKFARLGRQHKPVRTHECQDSTIQDLHAPTLPNRPPWKAFVHSGRPASVAAAESRRSAQFSLPSQPAGGTRLRRPARVSSSANVDFLGLG